MRLDGKISIVTGGGSGIGRATAQLFAKEGAKVVVADLKPETGQETIRNIRSGAGEACFVEVDVSKADHVNAMVETTLSHYGGIDILFNGAAVLMFGSVLETDQQAWSRVISVNLTGTFLCCKAVLPWMIKRGGGSIVNVSSSTGAHDACANAVAYVASKGGVALLTKAMAIDHARDNVRVNALCPGPTDTPMLREHMSAGKLKEFAATFPMKRLGRAEELAYAALFLASDESSFITGAMLPVDGGQTAEV